MSSAFLVPVSELRVGGLNVMVHADRVRRSRIQGCDLGDRFPLPTTTQGTYSPGSEGPDFRVYGLGFRDQGSRFEGAGFMAQGLGFRFMG